MPCDRPGNCVINCTRSLGIAAEIPRGYWTASLSYKNRLEVWQLLRAAKRENCSDDRPATAQNGLTRINVQLGMDLHPYRVMPEEE